MPRRTPLNDVLRFEAVRTGDRDAHGMSRTRLMRGPDVEHPFRGVSTASGPRGLDLTTIDGVCRALKPLMRSMDAISHVSAALLYGAPLPDAAPPLFPVHVTSLGVRAHRGPNVVGHEWAADSLRLDLVRGIRVIAAPDAWCQLSATLSPEDLVAVGDYLVWGVPVRGRRARTRPCCTVEELQEAVRRHGRRPGARALAWAVERVRIGADSRPETLLRLLLVAAGLPEPLLQDPVVGRDGRRYHPDLKLPQWRTVFEYEGVVHLRDPGRWRTDTRRYQQLEAAGWRVIRVNAEHLFVDRAGFLRYVFAELTSQAKRLGVAPPLSSRKQRI